MKILIRIFIILIYTSNYSQNETIFSVGINIVDDSFTSTYNPLNTSESWNIGKVPSYLSISSELIDRTFLEVQISSNEYQKGKLVNGSILLSEKKYFSIDIHAKYKLFQPYNNILNTRLIDPFILVGFGNTRIAKSEHTTLNYGLGIYFWLPKSRLCNCEFNENDGGNFGFLVSTLAKSSIKQATYGNQIQHLFGLVYRF